MLIHKILPKIKDNEFNVIIEIPMNDVPIKYEFDKTIGALIVDRFIQVSMSYPCNYGFIPNTLSQDGDPLDVLVMTHYPIIHRAIIKVRPVGVLVMEDESGMDEKILAVPTSKVDITFDSIIDIHDVSQILKHRIEHFFQYYKKLEKGKWVNIIGWKNQSSANNIIQEAIHRVSSTPSINND